MPVAENQRVAWPRFLSVVTGPEGLGRRIDQDPGQLGVVQASADSSLFVIAGPGTGKTTALALRVLKLVLVDGLDPAEVLATTFTKKAASELRSRIVGWGDTLRNVLLGEAPSGSALAARLSGLDLNRVRTGTLDSIAEALLTEFRAAGAQPPVVLDDFVARALFQRALWFGKRHQDPDLQAYAHQIRRDQRPPGFNELLEFGREVADRILHDRVDFDAFRLGAAHPGAQVLHDAITAYRGDLAANLAVDFAALEGDLFDGLVDGRLAEFAQGVTVVMVDEYQDTNALQEAIYFALAEHVCRRSGSITVVGDDDQSLYRFRGATVELFVDFPGRLQRACSLQAHTIALNHNYRSTPTIVGFFSDFASLDPQYQTARVANKPSLLPSRRGPLVNYPVLKLFRRDLPTLAHDLAHFIAEVFSGPGVRLGGPGRELLIKDPVNGRIGDCALLCSSPKEFSGSDRPRLPLLLRDELGRLGINVFNPRGQALSQISPVAELCGLLLECIDPGAQVQNAERLPNAVIACFGNWRASGQAVVLRDPPPPGRSRRTGTLRAFVDAWQRRRPQHGSVWPSEVPLLQLVYDLVSWFPIFQHDPEGLVYLEAIARTLTQMAPIMSYEGSIQRDEPHRSKSVKQVLWAVFAPIASGIIDVNEDLIEQLPGDRLNVLSIHQAKGLEFPLTIVDVGSDFTRNHHLQAPKRFPRDGSRSHRLEDELRQFAPVLGVPTRPVIDRAFDDLVRQYFVAFSRPQDALLLVGLGDPVGGPNERIANVAAGFTRDGQWPWRGLPRVVSV